MGTIVQTRVSRFAALTAIVSPRTPCFISAPAVRKREPRAFPEACTPPLRTLIMRDEMLEVYAFVFCQGGFRHLGMTFEQFLLVADAIKAPTTTRYQDKRALVGPDDRDRLSWCDIYFNSRMGSTPLDGAR